METIIIEYFGSSREQIIKDNDVKIYEILDEMLDNGFPMATEPNILKQLIKPPNLLRTITSAVTKTSTNVATILPSNQLSNVRWRREGIKYTNNEAYFDFIEEIDAIIDRSGNCITASANGSIDCVIKLSGMPDLTLSFTNPRLLDDVSLHPCVRFMRWDREKVLSFIPPDGSFRLFTYHVASINAMYLPVLVRQNLVLKEHGSRVELSLVPKSTGGKIVDNASISVRLPPEVLNLNLNVSQGKYTFDPTSRILDWNIGRVETQRLPTLRGSASMASGTGDQLSFSPVISVNFSISQFTSSGVKINRLDMYGEKYKPFKGVKYVTKAGNFEIRS